MFKLKSFSLTRGSSCYVSNNRHGSSKTSSFSEKNALPSANARINQIGIQMVSEKLRKYLFGLSQDRARSKRDDVLLPKVKEHLKKFNLDKPLNEKDLLPDVPGLELPKLMGNNIEEHIRLIAQKQTEGYLRLISFFTSNAIPQIPEHFSFTPGWTR
jgi:DNA polymerase gamma 1